nr:MAG TPA: putative AtpZ [Caudoviricetes sp.]
MSVFSGSLSQATRRAGATSALVFGAYSSPDDYRLPAGGVLGGFCVGWWDYAFSHSLIQWRCVGSPSK